VISYDAVTLQSTSGFVLVDNVSVELAPDVTSVLLGTPRATRQAFLRLLMRLDQPDRGQVRVNGADLRKVDGAKFRRSVGWLSGPPRLFPHLSVLDNVIGSGRLSGLSRREATGAAMAMLDAVAIHDVHAKPHTLAAADQVRAGLARAFVRGPSLVVLDDPFAGVDAVERGVLRDLLRGLRRDLGTTVVLATGDVEDALELGDRVLVLIDGVLVQTGTPLEILSRPSTGVESMLGSALGLRGLAFVTVKDIPVDDRSVIPVTATARQARRAASDNAWVLVVDEERRPLGWADTERLSDTGPVTEVPLVSVRGSVRSTDTMQRALDCIVSSPAQMVPRLDDEGGVLGLLSQTTLLRHLPDGRSA
jgi:osmoprotectant transport system ATP-binding protein